MRHGFGQPSTSTSMLAKKVTFFVFQLLWHSTCAAQSAEHHVTLETHHADPSEAQKLLRREHVGEHVEHASIVEIRSTGSQKMQPRGQSNAKPSHSETKVAPSATITDKDKSKAGSFELELFDDSGIEAKDDKNNKASLLQGDAAGMKVSKHDLFDDLILDEELLDSEGNATGDLVLSSLLAKKGGGWWFDRRRRVPCTWHSWGGWGACSTTCGYGSMVRYRGKNSAKHGGRSCAGSNSASGQCHPRYCPIHCKWSEWSQYTTCPVTCGSGLEKKSRYQDPAQAHGGMACDDPWLNQLERVCNPTPCKIHCEYGPWNGWTDCSLSCGVGMKQRSRDKVHSQEHKGDECPGEHVETAQCNTNPCPIDCEVQNWVGWSPCNKDCGGGETGRYRAMLVPDQHGGAPCPHLTEHKSCNEAPCEEVKAASTMTRVSIACVLSLIMTNMGRAEVEL